MSLKKSLTVMPDSRARRVSSSLTQSGTNVLTVQVALPIDGGKPIEREKAAWSAEAEVAAMLARCMAVCAFEFRLMADRCRRV